MAPTAAWKGPWQHVPRRRGEHCRGTSLIRNRLLAGPQHLIDPKQSRRNDQVRITLGTIRGSQFYRAQFSLEISFFLGGSRRGVPSWVFLGGTKELNILPPSPKSQKCILKIS